MAELNTEIHPMAAGIIINTKYKDMSTCPTDDAHLYS
jgi:hypothetical protein